MLFVNPEKAGDISFPSRKKDELSCRKLVEEAVVYGGLFGHFSGKQPMLQLILCWPRQEAEELFCILAEQE